METCLSARGFRSRRDQDHPVHLILTLVVDGMSHGKCIEGPDAERQRVFSAVSGFNAEQ